jgi:menaquinol-cytochrome c reductase iron-sulfur subunit
MAFQPTAKASGTAVPDFFAAPGQRRISMSAESGMSRRAMLVKLGLLLNGIVGAVLAVPIVRYLASPVIRERKIGYESWLSLGGLEQFPAGQTRLATYRNPVVNAWDGETADIACWVRNVDDQNFQVFAINCAHLGCPVRWFAQSNLFMCPCHGGAYYQDGSRASGPPERGLFQYHYKIEGGKLLIKAGEMPTPGQPLANKAGGKTTCA